MTSTDISFIAFKAISSFIKELDSTFGNDQHSLKLYQHLISKTTFSHTVAIAKHISIFRDFCVLNRDAITAMNDKLINQESYKITYSEKVSIDMKSIFLIADNDVKKVLWKHILTISAIVDPNGKAKQILLSKKSLSKEGEFISGILDKIESSVDPKGNPLDAIQGIMSSGVLSDLVNGMGSGLKDGTLDIGKLINSVQGLVTGMKDSDNDSTSPDIGKLMSGMMKGLGGGEGEGTPPDFGKMMGAMMGGQGDGAPPDFGKMMGAMMGGKGDGSQPDIGKLMSGMMKGLGGGEGEGAPPDFGKMMAGKGDGSQTDFDKMMGGQGDGATPDFGKMMGAMMSGKGDGSQPDFDKMMDGQEEQPSPDIENMMNGFEVDNTQSDLYEILESTEIQDEE